MTYLQSCGRGWGGSRSWLVADEVGVGRERGGLTQSGTESRGRVASRAGQSLAPAPPDFRCTALFPLPLSTDARLDAEPFAGGTRAATSFSHARSCRSFPTRANGAALSCTTALSRSFSVPQHPTHANRQLDDAFCREATPYARRTRRPRCHI